MFSYWERQTFIGNPDIVIIGSGIVGLSAAISLKEREPSLHLLVLERGMLPYGASTRNAGFACFGSPSELLDDLKNRSEDEVFSLVEKRWNGLQRLRKRIGDVEMNYEELGGYEIFCDGEEAEYAACLEALHRLNSGLQSITGLKETYVNADAELASFGFKNVKHLLLNRGEGQIDTGKMMDALVRKALQLQIRIMNGATVSHIESDEKQVRIDVSTDTITAGKVLIATNGFVSQFLPEEDVHPARAQVLITKPIEGLKVKGTFHYEKGYYYFRNVGNRLLLGGGRNLDFETEFTSEFGLTKLIQDKLDEMMRTVILPDNDYEVEMRWSGIMGLGKAKMPIVKMVKPGIYCSVRMGGMGVALGSLTGEEAADCLLRSL